MPSFQDSAVIFFIALLLFGPKKLPELARYVGKLMNEFRRASNEFRMQMQDEFRQAEQAEQQKKIAAMEAAAPIAPALPAETAAEVPSIESATYTEHIPDVPSMLDPASDPGAASQTASSFEVVSDPLPIASNGALHLMPPATGLPVARAAQASATPSSLGGLFDSIPHTPDPAAAHEAETSAHG